MILRKRAAFRRVNWNPGLWMKTRESSANVKSQTEIDYHNRINIVALKDDQIQLRWRVGWTGRGTVEPYIDNAGFSFSFEPAPIDPVHVLTITFDRPIHRRETVLLSFGLRTCADPNYPQQPFSSLLFNETKMPEEARIEVTFDPGVGIEWVSREEYSSETSPWPLNPMERTKLGAGRTVSWPFKCVRGRRYGIRWQYSI